MRDFPCHNGYNELLLKEIIYFFGSKLFPLREVPIMKTDAIELNHCLIE